ncbi:MAG: NfeD family protein [Rhodospirillales bacterium]|nr:NfeD family protein [Rhodospirillales bacterium]
MEAWWAELTTTLKVFWGIAIFSTVFFLLQTVMTFVGLSDMDADGDAGGGEGSHDAHSIADYFTVRNLVSFFLGFSWCGIVLIEGGSSLGVAIGGGTLMGLVLVAITLGILKILASLKSDGTLSLDNAIGHEGLVTITIPADKHHYGKVGISFQNRYRELEGISKDQQELIKGTRVKVVAISGSQLVVKPI